MSTSLFGSMLAAACMAVEIQSVHLYEYRIPRTSTFTTAQGSSSYTTGIFIHITALDEDGNEWSSWGDALPRLNVTSESGEDAWRGANFMAEALLGRTLTFDNLEMALVDIDSVMTELATIANAMELTSNRRPPPDRQLRATLTGFDVALLGLLGEVQQIPLYEVFGPAARDEVAISGLTASVGISPEEGERRVRTARNDYRCVRLKIGPNPDEDLELLRAVAETIVENRPDLEIFVDVNQAWDDAGTSIRELARIRRVLLETGFTGRFICEQPTRADRYEDLAAVTQVVRTWRERDPFSILIMADECLWDMQDLQKLVSLDAVDQVNFKIQKAGGLLETMRMGRYLAEERPEWEVYVGGLLMTDVGAAANLHIGHALPRLDYITGAMRRRMDVVNPATTPLDYRPGTRTLIRPAGPGYGTGVDLEVLQPFLGRTAFYDEN